jgi:hypothetical protein
MKREEKIRKSEDRRPKTGDRSRPPERQSRAGKSEVGTLIAIGREKGTAARNFSVLSFAPEKPGRIKENAKRERNIEYRITNDEYRSEEKGNTEYRLTNDEYRSEEKGNIEYRISDNKSGNSDHKNVSYSLFLIYYSLFISSAIDNSAQIAGNQHPAAGCFLNEIQQFNKPQFLMVSPFRGKSPKGKGVINQFSFNPLRQLADAALGAPCRQFRFAGDFLSINFLTMRELKQVLTKKVLAFLLPIYREVGGGSYCL